MAERLVNIVCKFNFLARYVCCGTMAITPSIWICDIRRKDQLPKMSIKTQSHQKVNQKIKWPEVKILLTCKLLFGGNWFLRGFW